MLFRSDLNFKNPEVLLEILDILLLYIERGATFIRLDAIAYLWKDLGTTCVHLPQTHAVIQFLRAAISDVAPHVQLITETNVPHSDNISYFGDGTNEAQLDMDGFTLVSSNVARVGGGGIYCINGGIVRMRGAIIANTAEDGGSDPLESGNGGGMVGSAAAGDLQTTWGKMWSQFATVWSLSKHTGGTETTPMEAMVVSLAAASRNCDLGAGDRREEL